MCRVYEGKNIGSIRGGTRVSDPGYDGMNCGCKYPGYQSMRSEVQVF